MSQEEVFAKCSSVNSKLFFIHKMLSYVSQISKLIKVFILQLLNFLLIILKLLKKLKFLVHSLIQKTLFYCCVCVL